MHFGSEPLVPAASFVLIVVVVPRQLPHEHRPLLAKVVGPVRGLDRASSFVVVRCQPAVPLGIVVLWLLRCPWFHAVVVVALGSRLRPWWPPSS